MSRKVEGFMTSTNQFFEDEQQADYAEALALLEHKLKSHGVRSVDAQVGLILDCGIEIMAFISAASNLEQSNEESNRQPLNTKPQDSANDYEIDTASFDGPEDDDDADGQVGDNQRQEDNLDTSEEAETVLTLPPGVRKPMPDVGRHIQQAKVRHERPVNGPRGGRGDAPGLRRR